MSSTQTVIRLIDRLKPLWLLITGGALAGIVGGALTLFYFIGIGGVPVGQTASAGALSGLVLSMALILGVMVVAIWVSPALVAHMTGGDGVLAEHLPRMFTRHGSLTQAAPMAESAWVLIDVEAEAPPRAVPRPRVLWHRALLFSLTTVGSGCLGMILFASGIADLGEGTRWRFVMPWLCVAAPLTFTGVGLTCLWRWFNRSAHGEPQTLNGDGEAGKAPSGYGYWMYFGYLSGLMAVTPFVLLVLVFIEGDLLRRHESWATFWLGAGVISLAIVMAFCSAVAVLVQRDMPTLQKWLGAAGINLMVLCLVIVVLGMSSRLLERVMMLASVRVEHAIVVLDDDGCTLLKSIGVRGWSPGPAGNGKSCLLVDVTIQSTLEPSMQIACWRGAVDKQVAPASAPANVASSPASGPLSFTYAAQGSFTLPAKAVRSIWKTKAGKGPELGPVCPVRLDIEG